MVWMPSLPSALSCVSWDGLVLGSVCCNPGEEKFLLKTLSQDVRLFGRKAQFHQRRLGLGKSKSKQTMVQSVPSCSLRQQMHTYRGCARSHSEAQATPRRPKTKRTANKITRRGNSVLAALWSDQGSADCYVLESSFSNLIPFIDFPKCRL